MRSPEERARDLCDRLELHAYFTTTSGEAVDAACPLVTLEIRAAVKEAVRGCWKAQSEMVEMYRDSPWKDLPGLMLDVLRVEFPECFEEE